MNLPPQAIPWARTHNILLLGDLTPTNQPKTSEPGDISNTRLMIRSPGDRTIFQIAPGTPLANQQIQLEAVGENGLLQVQILVDGIVAASFDSAPYETWWQLVAGDHEILAEAVAADGSIIRSEPVRIMVKP